MIKANIILPFKIIHIVICLCILIYIFIVRFDDYEEEKVPPIVKSQTVDILVGSEKSQKDATRDQASKFIRNKDKRCNYDVKKNDRNPNFNGYIDERVDSNGDSISFSNSDETNKANPPVVDLVNKHLEDLK